MKEVLKKGDYLDALLRSKKTVFSTNDIAMLWGGSDMHAANVRLNYYVKKKKLVRVRRGIYAKDEHYNKYEVGEKIFSPSYISFETVLRIEGINFQYYETIFLASYLRREIECDDQTYSFQTIKKNVLVNPAGINVNGEYSIATKERAFLDTVYRSKDYHFDNLSPLDWDKVFEILPIYENKEMTKTVKKFYKYYLSTK
ncbi:MAG: type IV toxin-antitoxin system AbiEi family antitoxin domain-containing protein [Candidatus Gracilibacteria bacterium]